MLSFMTAVKVADLDLDEPSEYGLELIDEAGKVMPAGEALK
jgi:hypothetical protein